MPRNFRCAIGCRAARAPLFGDISAGADDIRARARRLLTRALPSDPFLVSLLDSLLMPAPQAPSSPPPPLPLHDGRPRSAPGRKHG
eukprot:IDg1970t1